jgi:hypothetical protein
MLKTNITTISSLPVDLSVDVEIAIWLSETKPLCEVLLH